MSQDIYGAHPENPILIVDDMPQNIQVLGKLLSDDGYNIAFARSGAEALEKIHSIKPCLVLLDIMMPGMDGFEVMRRLKMDPETTLIPVLFVTAKNETVDIVHGFREGALDYVTKPFNPAELLARVRTHVNLKLATDTIVRQVDEMRKMNALKDRFFSIMAHDLKNPFNSLLGLTDLLVNRYESMDDAKRIQFIEDIHSSSLQLYALLEKLLDWSRLQVGSVRFNPVVFNLYDTVSVVISLFRQTARDKEITLSVSGNEKIMAKADRNMVETILRNLISNAVKFTRPRGEVTVSMAGAGDLVFVEVADNGMGMDQDEVSSLFRIDVHHTTPGTMNEKGTGIGLILCHDLAQTNRGSITVISEKGRGSTFRLILPAGESHKGEGDIAADA